MDESRPVSTIKTKKHFWDKLSSAYNPSNPKFPSLLGSFHSHIRPRGESRPKINTIAILPSKERHKRRENAWNIPPSFHQRVLKAIVPSILPSFAHAQNARARKSCARELSLAHTCSMKRKAAWHTRELLEGALRKTVAPTSRGERPIRAQQCLLTLHNDRLFKTRERVSPGARHATTFSPERTFPTFRFLSELEGTRPSSPKGLPLQLNSYREHLHIAKT